MKLFARLFKKETPTIEEMAEKVIAFSEKLDDLESERVEAAQALREAEMMSLVGAGNKSEAASLRSQLAECEAQIIACKGIMQELKQGILKQLQASKEAEIKAIQQTLTEIDENIENVRSEILLSAAAMTFALAKLKGQEKNIRGLLLQMGGFIDKPDRDVFDNELAKRKAAAGIRGTSYSLIEERQPLYSKRDDLAKWVPEMADVENLIQRTKEKQQSDLS